jgi:hypothetical protein
MSWQLRLYEDRLERGAAASLPAGNRVIYVTSGGAAIDGADIPEDEAWFGSDAVSVTAGEGGTVFWRYELCRADAAPVAPSGDGLASERKLSADITTLDPGDGRQWLMRCDSVAFPPGGCAYTHTHQGPGIRCLRDGTIRIDAEGASHHYAPGEAWFEAGPDPVFAQADTDKPTRFIRAMILPRALKGQSSIRYVRDDDRDKPKLQQYRGYVDEFIEV